MKKALLPTTVCVLRTNVLFLSSSGESAKGKYPSETVTFMNEIILAAERYADSGALGRPTTQPFLASPKTADSAIARAAVTSSQERTDTAAILVLTNHGTLPRLVSAFRPHVPILSFVPTAKLGRQLQLYRGVIPIVGLNDIPVSEKPLKAIQMAKDMGYVRPGEEVVIVSMDEEDSVGRTATLKIATV